MMSSENRFTLFGIMLQGAKSGGWRRDCLPWKMAIAAPKSNAGPL
jgi:hypothetical protein